MSEGDSFFDTSVLLYLLSEDSNKADRVETEDLQHGQVIDAQLRVVNPFLKG